jgi:hypothetical protein
VADVVAAEQLQALVGDRRGDRAVPQRAPADVRGGQELERDQEEALVEQSREHDRRGLPLDAEARADRPELGEDRRA